MVSLESPVIIIIIVVIIIIIIIIVPPGRFALRQTIQVFFRQRVALASAVVFGTPASV